MTNIMPDEAPLLELETMIGFGGDVKQGLMVHPDKQFIIYPVGCTVVIEDIGSKSQEFFNGHTNNVSCITVSRSGKYVASGQVTHPGFKADMYLWDFYERRAVWHFKPMHHNKVEALAISPSDKYLVSLGGQDDGSICVWNISTGDAICGAPAQVMSAGCTRTIAYFNHSDEKFVTGGDNTLRVWDLDVGARKVKPTEVNVGQIKRNINCIEVDSEDAFFYCGTTTGDIMMVNTKSNNFQKHGPTKERFSLGVTALCLLKTGDFLVGSGCGDVQIINEKFKPTTKKQKVEGAVSSIALRGSGHQFFVGTSKCNIYRFDFAEFTQKLITTCHHHMVNDIVFPHNSSDLVVTCSSEDIRIWNTNDCKELLRIVQPNKTCNALAIMKDGGSIITGWDDGKIRAFSPESGSLLYIVEHSYGASTTALATTSDNRHIISGTNLGHVVVWDVPDPLYLRTLKKGSAVNVTKHDLLKEHKAQVTCIKINMTDTECVTSSIDGSCIIWDLLGLKRKMMIRVNTLFQYTCYGPDDYHIITTGTDRKIGYWEISDGSMIREVEGSLSGSVNCMDISGHTFVSGGDDKLVKLWNYDQGTVQYIGKGHSAAITGVKIAPCGPYDSKPRFIISVSKDGAILKWRFPDMNVDY